MRLMFKGRTLEAEIAYLGVTQLFCVVIVLNVITKKVFCILLSLLLLLLFLLHREKFPSSLLIIIMKLGGSLYMVSFNLYFLNYISQ